jgi:peptidyl-prolyl cis-trans isomerase SurA
MFFTSTQAPHRWLLIALSALCLHGLTQAQTTAPKANATAGRDFIVAVVDAVPITNHDVNQRVLLLKQLARQQDRVQSQLTPSLQVALEKLITEKALLQLAKDQGITVDAAAISQEQERVAAQSQLNVAALRAKLSSAGVSWESFQQSIKDQLTVQRLAERTVPARVRVSDAEIDAVMRERMNARSNINPNIELAHILIAVPEQASPTQVSTLQAKAQNTLQRLQAGENFADVAKDVSNSTDKEQGGRMGVRPMDRYPTLFVQAIEALPVGGLSSVFRSGAGFHILKLVSKQSNQTMVVTETRARHILLRPGGQLSQIAARGQLANFKRDLEAGRADFAKLAKEHSQDGSADNGGDLGWVAPGVFVPEFEEAMDKLKINQISDPLVSRFGVHLIQVLARRDAPISERELRESARNMVRQRKFDETYEQWAQEVRGRAYIEYRDPPQ